MKICYHDKPKRLFLANILYSRICFLIKLTRSLVKTLCFCNKKVLISGGLGFIGSNLAIELVKQGADVTIVDSLIPEYGGNLWNIEPVKDKVRINISDVRDEHSMQYLVQNQDFFFNLAGQTSHLDSMVNPFPDLEINSRAQLIILEACRKFNPRVKIVYASTRQIYGRPNYLPVDEKHPLNPVDINGINKLSGEWYHIVYNSVYGIPAVVLRLTNTYGPRMRIKDARQTFLGIWIRNLLENKPIIVYGDGCQIRDYNYIDDVVDALMLAANSELPAATVYNLGHHKPVTLTETAKLMVDAYGEGSFRHIPFPDTLKSIDIGDFYGNYDKINTDLNWKPSTGLAEGMEKTIGYFREFYERYI
jgi:UDP-glucose 4-epimerase